MSKRASKINDRQRAMLVTISDAGSMDLTGNRRGLTIRALERRGLVTIHFRSIGEPGNPGFYAWQEAHLTDAGRQWLCDNEGKRHGTSGDEDPTN